MTGTYDRVNHRYAINGDEAPSVTRILKHPAAVAELARCGVAITPDAPWYTDEARDRGTDVHALTERADAGWHDLPADPITAGRLEAYRRFVVEQDVEILEVEQQVYCERFWYAGTFDRVLRLRRTGKLYTVDLKPNPADWHRVQLAAYARLKGIDDTAALYLRPDGSYKFKPFPADKRNAALFLRARLAVGDTWRMAA
jgi:hypothetical protein